MHKDNRPYVVMQMSASVDGRIAFGPGLTMFDKHPAEDLVRDAGPIWEKVADAIRTEWQPQGTMWGSGIFQTERAPLRELPAFAGDAQALYADFFPEDVIANTKKWDILVDGRGRCRGGYKSTEKPGYHILHLVSRSAPAEYLAFLRRERIPYLMGGQEHADMTEALNKLYALLGIRVMTLMGGGTLNGVMLRAGFIDEVHLILWPLLIGGRRTPTLADCGDLLSDGRPEVLQLVSAQVQDGGYLWLHYKVTNT
jgi:2,5-diamino-6-(ribosylamino)-4(3H)-pyrimidinone 5'-phosphate reductase